jgi:alkylation response protein AidB-like acyl-CoA dehydrogenase
VGIAITEEHRALADSVAKTVARHAPLTLARTVLDSGDESQAGSAAAALGEQGLLGLHVSEDHGGAGYGVEELAIVAEQFGRGLVPGTAVPSLLASAAIARFGSATLAKEVLPGLADGSVTAAVGVGIDPLPAQRSDADVLTITGTSGPIIGGASAAWFVLPVRDGDRVAHVAVAADDLEVTRAQAFDGTRSVATVTAESVEVPVERVLDVDLAGMRDLATVVLGAEAAGIADWCLQTATDYAKVREQFGRPIGQFQGVKHRCAEMLVRVEEARAAVWDAARAVDEEEFGLAAAVAASVTFDAAYDNALEAIQILGGIGFTWEHDAHMYLRRATVLRQLVGGGDVHRRRVTDLALDGHRRTLHLELAGDEADRIRTEVADFAASLDGLDESQRRSRLAESGYQVPHWPRPWGREATPIEQLVIDEQLAAAGIQRPNIFIGGWILPTIITYGTPEQQDQFIVPTLRGDIVWCQLFSEPGAGSDLAALQTKAVKVDGGWRVTGQKVWTSLAHRSEWGLLIARTDPDAPKHQGITAFLLDMQHSEGLDIRPLREMTGNELFNEVYLDDVFIPDEMVVGPVDGGWKAARNTLSNERVAMSGGSVMGSGVEGVLKAFGHSRDRDDPLVRDRLGGLIAEGQVLGLLGFRTTLAQLSGVEPGAGSSVRKLVGGHHARECAAMALDLMGPAGVVAEGVAEQATFMFLQAQCLTIAGGTTNVQLNVIAERLLGLPRDDAGEA